MEEGKVEYFVAYEKKIFKISSRNTKTKCKVL